MTNEEILKKYQALAQEGNLSGMFTDIPNEVYHHPDFPGLSKSNLDQLTKSYTHLEKSIEKAREERLVNPKHYLVGQAFHVATLEPEKFDDLYALKLIAPKVDRRTTEGKKLYKEWEDNVYLPYLDSVVGKELLEKEELDCVMGMKQSVLSNDLIKGLVGSSDKEVTFFWKDKKTGILCRCRPDFINFELGIIGDLKSTSQGADAPSFSRSVVKYNYDKQAAFYADGVEQVTGKKFKFIFVACETSEPYLSQSFYAADDVLDVGRELYRENLEYCSRVQKGEAEKGYSKDIQQLGLPAYGYDTASRSMR